MDLTPDQAVAVIQKAIEAKMFPEGAIPASDADKIKEASTLVEMALQAKEMKENLGAENMPRWPAAAQVLTAAGIDPESSDAPATTPAAEAVPAESPGELPKVGEPWYDAEGNVWVVVKYEGGPQLEAVAVATGETALLPAGFLKERANLERRFCEGNKTLYTMQSIEGDLVYMTDPTGARVQIAKEHWDTWPVQEWEQQAVPEPPAAEPEQIPDAQAAKEEGDLPKNFQPSFTIGEHRKDGAGNVWELKSIDDSWECTITAQPDGGDALFPFAEWQKWPVLEAEQAPQAPVEEPAPPAPVQEPPAKKPRMTQKRKGLIEALVIGENRTQPTDGNTMVLKSVNDDGTLEVTDIFGGHQSMLDVTEWSKWKVVEGQMGLQQEDLAPPDPPTTEPDPESEPQAPASEDRSASQQFDVPVDDDEGDDSYANLLAKVTDAYSPKAMPAPMDLERPPTEIPDDLTSVDDIEARRLHSQFNALAARARYLYGLEAAKARGCDRLFKHNLKHAMREKRSELGAALSVTEVQQHAEDVDVVSDWMRRRDSHQDAADAYKTFLDIYTEHVKVLSRDWSMRSKEEAGS